MYKFFCLLVCIILTTPVYALDPIVACPSGYVALPNQHIKIVESVCPGGTIEAVDYRTRIIPAEAYLSTCLGTPTSPYCFMYYPTNTVQTDGKGSYVFTEVCELSN